MNLLWFYIFPLLFWKIELSRNTRLMYLTKRFNVNFSKICFLFTFFYTVVARSGGGMVDVRSRVLGRAILPRTSIRETVRHSRGVHDEKLKIQTYLPRWWNGRSSSGASDTLAVHGTWIPRKNSKIHRRLGVDALGWWNGRHVRFRCVCLRVCGFKSHLEHQNSE